MGRLLATLVVLHGCGEPSANAEPLFDWTLATDAVVRRRYAARDRARQS
jgi:hypothetical protein